MITDLAEFFYGEGKMPCCGKEIKYYEGPEGACCINIKCAHCGEMFNICPSWFIEKIGYTETKLQSRRTE